MDVAVSAIIAAIIASVVSLAWNWYERAASQRQALYEAQLHAAVEVADALWETVDGSPETWAAFLKATAQYGAILPGSVIDALSQVIDARDQEGSVRAQEAGRVIQAMRVAFGTQELSQQALDRIGRKSSGT